MSRVLQLLQENNITTFEQCREFLRQEPYCINCRYFGTGQKAESEKYTWKHPVFRLHFTDKSDLSNIIVRECRGLILFVRDMDKFEIDFTKVAAYGMPKGTDIYVVPNGEKQLDEISEQDPEPQGLNAFSDLTKCHITESVDGTFIKLYHMDGIWYPATHKTLNAFWKGAYWHGPKTFGEMWREAAFHIDWKKLNPSWTYWFILQHPENRIVKKYVRPGVTHIGTIDNVTCRPIPVHDSPVLQKNGNTYPSNDAICGLNTWLDLVKYVNQLPMDVPGVTIYDPDANEWLNVYNDKYMGAHALKGNYQNMMYQYMLLRQEGRDEEFIQLYPEYCYLETFLNERLEQVAAALFDEYSKMSSSATEYKSANLELAGILVDFAMCAKEIEGSSLPQCSVVTEQDAIEYLERLEPKLLSELLRINPQVFDY